MSQTGLPPELLERFANFAFYMTLKYNGYKLTKLQLEMCDYMQYGPKDDERSSDDRLLMGYRGLGKTSIGMLFVIWRFLRNQAELILLVASDGRPAEEFGSATRNLIETCPELAVLRINRKDGRTKATAWDVPGNLRLSKQSSFTGLGIGAGELTGKRADFILMEDWEVSATCRSSVHRDNLVRTARELFNVMADDKPGCYKMALGTPHVADSFYKELWGDEFNFDCRIFPALYPDPNKSDPDYLKMVSPTVMNSVLADPQLIHKPTDRLGEKALSKKPGGMKSTAFRMQFMLDMSITDEDVYPLRCSDLIVMDCDAKALPHQVVWTNDPDYCRNWKCPGLAGDRFYLSRPIPADVKFGPPELLVMYVDTAGGGADEMVYVVAAVLRGMIFILDMAAFRRSQQEIRFPRTAQAVRNWGVKKMRLETNTNLSAVELMRSHLDKIGAICDIEGHHNSQKKELRVINTLSEVMAQHRLVINSSVVQHDAQSSTGNKHYQLFYQLTHARMEARCGLRHDDRVDALCGAVEMLSPYLGYDADASDVRIRDERHMMREWLFGAGEIGEIGGLGENGIVVRYQQRTMDDAERLFRARF